MEKVSHWHNMSQLRDILKLGARRSGFFLLIPDRTADLHRFPEKDKSIFRTFWSEFKWVFTKYAASSSNKPLKDSLTMNIIIRVETPSFTHLSAVAYLTYTIFKHVDKFSHFWLKVDTSQSGFSNDTPQSGYQLLPLVLAFPKWFCINQSWFEQRFNCNSSVGNIKNKLCALKVVHPSDCYMMKRCFNKYTIKKAFGNIRSCEIFSKYLWALKAMSYNQIAWREVICQKDTALNLFINVS